MSVRRELFAAAIAPPCGCPHTAHQFSQLIHCGGPRREHEGTVYCLGCWAAVFQPALAIANDSGGQVRILDFSRLDLLYNSRTVSADEAWGACNLPSRHWADYARSLAPNTETDS
jgi:hypothetical protein